VDLGRKDHEQRRQGPHHESISRESGRGTFASRRLLVLGCAAPMADSKKKKKSAKRERKERRF
jgi:hypothetical protein